jgi:hypothetical protein
LGNRGPRAILLLGAVGGSIKISSLSDEGKEIVFGIINAGEIFGEIAVLDGEERSADATAMTDCELLLLNRRDFLHLLETPGGSLHDPAENPVPTAAAASGIGTFANFSPCAGLWRQKSVSQWIPPLEGRVSCELVSENAKFPASRENTGNFFDLGLGSASEAAKKVMKSSFLRANSLRILTGNFLQPCRELNRTIREVSAVIREFRLPPQFGVRLVTNPIIDAVGRVARARVQRAHRRYGIEGSNRLPPTARPLRTWTSSTRVDPGRMAPGLAGLRVGAFWEPDDPALISLPGPARLGAS